jgi:hypothetical protein
MPEITVTDSFIIEEFDAEETCVHGMAAWLCAHPIYHYPTDEMMQSGRYY